jgi:hypothetical protein
MGDLANLFVNVCSDTGSDVITVYNKIKTNNFFNKQNSYEKVNLPSLSLFHDAKNTVYCNSFDKPWNDPIRKYIIPKDSKPSILDELRKCQIHQGTLFSDLDGYAAYLGIGGD